MTAFQQALVNWAVSIANNDYYYYHYTWEDNVTVPHFDCATYLSYVIYQASGWNDWYDRSYFWPHISDPGYDSFLLNNGWQKFPFSSSYLTEGAIIIMDETWGHTFMYIGNGQICEANDKNDTDHGPTSIEVCSYSKYEPYESDFAFIYLPPDVTPGPGPGPGPITNRYCPKTYKRKRGF